MLMSISRILDHIFVPVLMINRLKDITLLYIKFVLRHFIPDSIWEMDMKPWRIFVVICIKKYIVYTST